MPSIYRSYQRDVFYRLLKIEAKEELNVKVKDISTATYDGFIYHIYLATAKKDNGEKKRNVLLSGGMHGNEPGGVPAILDFLEYHSQLYLDNFNFYAYPCLNPSGYKLNKRETRLDVDLNLSFTDCVNSIEARLVSDSLREGPEKYLFTVDMHECEGDPDGHTPNEFFMWEYCKDEKRRVAPKIIKAVEKDVPICKWKNILCEESENGVIYYPESYIGDDLQKPVTLDEYLHKYHTKHAFTIETPSWMSIEKRSQIHIKVLTTVLDEYLEKWRNENARKKD